MKRINAIYRFAIWVFLILAIKADHSYCQGGADSLNKKRLHTFLIGTGVVYTAGLIALNEAWYSDYPKEDFHFFDDSQEWKQMDKLGHLYTGFQLSKTSSMAFRWSGLSDKKSAIWGSIMGFALMVPIELMDGYSSEYGASGSDIVANALGAGIYLGQELLWNQVKIHPKYSYSQSEIAQYRPDVLGKNGSETWLKDYNGQTYWLSFDMYSLVNMKPKWLNFSLGYGVNNMVNAGGTPTAAFPYESYRQYYLGIDFDLTHIKTNSKAVKSIIYFVNMIRLPAPALEFNKNDKLIFHPLYF